MRCQNLNPIIVQSGHNFSQSVFLIYGFKYKKISTNLVKAKIISKIFRDAAQIFFYIIIAPVKTY